MRRYEPWQPNYIRALNALKHYPGDVTPVVLTREYGISNGPDAIAQLRHKGYDIATIREDYYVEHPVTHARIHKQYGRYKLVSEPVVDSRQLQLAVG